MKVSRQQVLAYRTRAQGLLREATKVSELSVLDLGIQEAMGHPAAAALDARLAKAPPEDVFGPDKPLALVWSLRGAPHVHRRRELNGLAKALYPMSEADAVGRLNETGPSVAKAGIPGLEQYRLAVEAMAEVVGKPTAKGAASAAMTKRLPNEMGRDCRPCKARHISDSAMRTAALAAGVELQPGTAPPVLLPRASAARPDHVDKAAVQRLIDAYLRLLGPATVRDVADYLGARRGDLEQFWPDKLAEVDVGGSKAFIPAAVADELAHAKPVEMVRLVGGFDPFLQARDRDLIVPDKAAQKALWPVLGRPGAVLVDGDVAGLWRPKTSGKKLTLTVETFGAVPARVWEHIDVEAERVAAYRGAASVSVTRV